MIVLAEQGLRKEDGSSASDSMLKLLQFLLLILRANLGREMTVHTIKIIVKDLGK